MIPDGFIPLICFDIKTDLYYINKEGQIWSTYRNKIMSPHKSKVGYMAISLHVNDDSIIDKRFKIHRLLMQTFKPIENPEEYVVNHLDGDKLNNDLENLEWTTSIKNSNHAKENGLYKVGNDHPFNKYDSNVITRLCEIMETKFYFKDIVNDLYSIYSIEIKHKRKFQSTIYNIRQGKGWKHISKNYPNILKSPPIKNVKSSTTIKICINMNTLKENYKYLYRK